MNYELGEIKGSRKGKIVVPDGQILENANDGFTDSMTNANEEVWETVILIR